MFYALKFSSVRSSHDLSACAHVHNLEGVSAVTCFHDKVRNLLDKKCADNPTLHTPFRNI